MTAAPETLPARQREQTRNTQGLIPWKPGQSGNPSGRPRGIARVVRDTLGSEGPARLVRVLLAIVEDDRAKDRDRIAAARELLDRGYGKAPEHAPIVDGDPLEQGPVQAAIADLIGELRTSYARLEDTPQLEPPRPAGGNQAAIP